MISFCNIFFCAIAVAKRLRLFCSPSADTEYRSLQQKLTEIVGVENIPDAPTEAVPDPVPVQVASDVVALGDKEQQKYVFCLTHT